MTEVLSPIDAYAQTNGDFNNLAAAERLAQDLHPVQSRFE